MRFRTLYRGLIIALIAALVSACAAITAQSRIGAGYSGTPITALKSTSFGSALAAVIAAQNEYNPLSIAQDREFIGAILHHQGKYRYTVAHGLSGEDTVTVRVTVPRGAKLVAFWHTHGAAGLGRRYFSGVDTALVNGWNKPFYMADYSGTLRVFQPGDATITAMQARRLGLGDRAGYAKGRICRIDDNVRVRIATRRFARL